MSEINLLGEKIEFYSEFPSTASRMRSQRLNSVREALPLALSSYPGIGDERSPYCLN